VGALWEYMLGEYARHFSRANIERTVPLGVSDGSYEFLLFGTEYRHWFPRMCEYGFTAGVDFNPVIFERVQMERGRSKATG